MCIGPQKVSRTGHGVTEFPVNAAGFDASDRAILEICRFFFQSYTIPQTQSWTRSFAAAHEAFGPDRSGQVVAATLRVVQTMRIVRRSGFRFSNPDCPQCAHYLSANERQLMGIIVAARKRHTSDLHAHAMVLCEGNDTRLLLAAIDHLTSVVRVSAHRDEILH